jgi:hypothetical protein
MFWTPPVLGCLKLNTDASFIADTNKGSSGAVLRDERGHVVLSASGTNGFYSAANITEVLASLQGISELCAATPSWSAISDRRRWALSKKWFFRRLLETQIDMDSG